MHLSPLNWIHRTVAGYANLTEALQEPSAEPGRPLAEHEATGSLSSRMRVIVHGLVHSPVHGPWSRFYTNPNYCR